MKAGSNGFSLIELLIVVGLVGFLATAIFFGDTFSFKEKARKVENQSVFQLAELAIEQYANLCGQYPPQSAGSAAIPFAANKGCPTGMTLNDLISTSEAQGMSILSYVPYASLYADNCVGYHLSMVVESGDSILVEDHDIDSSSEPSGVTHCVTDASTLSGVDGEDPVYDIMKPASLRSLF